MKNNSWKKDYLVVIYSEYNDTWTDITIPCTFLQAIRFAHATPMRHRALNEGRAKIVTRAEFATLNKTETA